MAKYSRLVGLTCALSLASQISFAQNATSEGVKVFDPKVKSGKANPAALDTESFEAGIFVGMLSVEDFNTNSVLGVSFNYYFNERWFANLSYGNSETERSNPETVDGGNFVADRNFQYSTLAGGYQFLKGRSFFGKKRKYNSGLYVIAGIEQVDVTDSRNSGLLIGVSYKTTLTDWLNVSLDFKDHIVSRDFADDTKTTQNTEISLGLSTFF
ncbi:MAG: outer membrane beta-barrel domain-containing protein [Agarilytica sp.]